jgi:hypothetical protein
MIANSLGDHPGGVPAGAAIVILTCIGFAAEEECRPPQRDQVGNGAIVGMLSLPLGGPVRAGAHPVRHVT